MMLHLARQHIMQRQVSALRPIDPEVIGRCEKRREEREALNVIPMRVSEQDGGRDWTARIFHQFVSEQPRAGTAIEDHARASFSGELDAGCISAEVIGVGTGRRNRSACTPKAQAHGDFYDTLFDSRRFLAATLASIDNGIDGLRGVSFQSIVYENIGRLVALSGVRDQVAQSLARV